MSAGDHEARLERRLERERAIRREAEAIAEGATRRLYELSERLKHSESELRMREAQLEEAQELAHLGSWSWDVLADAVAWSDELYRIYGVEPTAFAATYEGLLALVHPDDRDLVRDAVERSLVAAEPFEFDHRILRPDGEERWVHGRGQVVTDADGKPTRMFGTAQDITARRRVDESLRQFIAIASHELQSPLAPIVGLTQTLLMRWGSITEQEKIRFVEAIRRQASRLSRLAGELLTLSRLEAGALEVNPEVVDVTTVLRRVAADAPDGRGVGFRCPGTLLARADQSLLEQILVNYLDNACKYGADPIVLEADDAGDFVEVRVRDEGEGVPPVFVPRLFDRFTQAHPARQVRGSGLGLSIVRGLARAQGGEVWYEPNRPKGACFGVRLPKPGVEVADGDHDRHRSADRR